MIQRRELNFPNIDAVVNEVSRLRGGCDCAGNWTLPQICRHLDIAMRYSMGGPPATIPAGPRSEKLQAILASGKIPPGIRAPERAVPPDNTPDEAVDQFLTTLAALKEFTGEFAVHQLFGPVAHDDFVRLHLIHCAHHLGHLSPKSN